VSAPTDVFPAAERMDAIYRWQVGIYDATRKFYLLGRDDLIAALDPPSGGTVLEVGCGTGRNLVVAARRYPHARFFGFDVSPVMLAEARRAVARAGLADRIHLARADAAGFDPLTCFARDGFDRVFCSYTLSMIPPWQEALDRAMEAVLPGGSLHVVDFGGQAQLPGLFRAGLRAWLAQFHVTPRDGFAERFGEAAAARGFAMRLERPFRDYAVHAVATRPGLA
jgi:S-adenosylmethionine-diacylgycerolhomoserine-N-methlytransferase